MIAGVSVEVGSEAVVVRSRVPLRVLSSAVHHGGLASARAVVNLHVRKHDACADPAGMIEAFARRAGVRRRGWVCSPAPSRSARCRPRSPPAGFTRWPSSRWG